MESFDSKLRQILNMFCVDSDTGIPDYILEQFLCKIIDSLTVKYQTMPDNRDLSDVVLNSEMYSEVLKDFTKAFSSMQAEMRTHKGLN